MRQSGWDRRAAARRLMLLAAAALALFLWSRYGGLRTAAQAFFAHLLPQAAATVAESAPPLPTAVRETETAAVQEAAPTSGEPVLPVCAEETPAPRTPVVSAGKLRHIILVGEDPAWRAASYKARREDKRRKHL